MRSRKNATRPRIRDVSYARADVSVKYRRVRRCFRSASRSLPRSPMFLSRTVRRSRASRFRLTRRSEKNPGRCSKQYLAPNRPRIGNREYLRSHADVGPAGTKETGPRRVACSPGHAVTHGVPWFASGPQITSGGTLGPFYYAKICNGPFHLLSGPPPPPTPRPCPRIPLENRAKSVRSAKPVRPIVRARTHTVALRRRETGPISPSRRELFVNNSRARSVARSVLLLFATWAKRPDAGPKGVNYN